jgi:hypothetical protein
MKMRRMIIAAAVLLAIQLALAVALNITDKGSRAVSPAAPLFGYAADAVTDLSIIGPEGDRVVLRKKDGGWILPDLFAAPAAGEQVNGLLTKLADLKQGFTVAASAEAARRFKVADDGFERHVVVKEGDLVVGDLYIGSSPAFRQVHARKAESADIFTIALSNFDLETGGDKWLDKNMFRLKTDDIDSLAFADFDLRRKDEGWRLADLEEGRELDKNVVDDLLVAVVGLTIQEVLNPQEVADLFKVEPALAFTVGLKDGSKLEYRFAKPDADFFVLKQSGRELYCKVHTIQVENLRKYTREKLVKQEEKAEVEEAAEPQQPAVDLDQPRE